MSAARCGMSVAVIACAAAALTAAGPSIKPVPGIVLTTTVHANIVSAAKGAFGYMDAENLISLTGVGPEGLTYSVRMSSPSNKVAEEELKKFKLVRKVRREDLEQSSRMTLLYATSDPESYGGQTFAETSTKVINALKTSGETPFVFGPYEGFSKAFAAAQPLVAATENVNSGIPGFPTVGSLFSNLLGSARHYYRGTLRRVEPGDVNFSVLLNGVRTDVPAVHAAGTFNFAGEDPAQVQIWWLDNPDYPINLKWVFGQGSSIVTRIDLPVASSGGAAAGGAGAAASMAAELAGKNWRAELHGIYFSTGSAVLLEESEPMLKQVAAVIKETPAASLTIEGHTDNIGSAAYNQTLSERRAESVRQALLTRYQVPASRLSAKGFGLTRPVETNDTYEGRAHNRRVELSRACPGGR